MSPFHIFLDLDKTLLFRGRPPVRDMLPCFGPTPVHRNFEEDSDPAQFFQAGWGTEKAGVNCSSSVGPWFGTASDLHNQGPAILPESVSLPREVEVRSLDIPETATSYGRKMWVTSRPDLRTFLEALVSLPNSVRSDTLDPRLEPPGIRLHFFTANPMRIALLLKDFVLNTTGIDTLTRISLHARPEGDENCGDAAGSVRKTFNVTKDFTRIVPPSELCSVQVPSALRGTQTFYSNAVLLDDREENFTNSPIEQNGLLARPFDQRFLAGFNGQGRLEKVDTFLLGEALPLISGVYGAYASNSAHSAWHEVAKHNQRVRQEAGDVA